MHKIIYIFFLIISTSCFAQKNEINTTIVDVYDGDTVKFEYNYEIVRGRLAGIDTPEINQDFGIEARDYLRALVLNKNVDIVFEEKEDKYGRYLITIFDKLENVNRELVKNGYAWAYMDNKKYKIYQDNARSFGLGLWGVDDKDSIISPSTFRKMRNPNYFVKLKDHKIPECRTADFKVCAQFNNCFEAMFWNDICGHTYLDRNDNGIPCETICK